MVMMKVMVTVAMVIVVLMLTLVMMPGGIAPTLIKSAHFVNSLEVERHGPAGKLETNKFRRMSVFLIVEIISFQKKYGLNSENVFLSPQRFLRNDLSTCCSHCK